MDKNLEKQLEEIACKAAEDLAAVLDNVAEEEAIKASQDEEAERLEEEYKDECDCNADELIIGMIDEIIINSLNSGEKISKSTRKNLLALNHIKETSLAVLGCQVNG